MGGDGWRSILSVGPIPLCQQYELIRFVVGRKQEVYTMQWKIKSLSDYIVCGAKYGGPIGRALIRLIAEPGVNERLSK